MRLNKEDFTQWLIFTQNRILRLNDHISLFEEPLKIGFRGKRHRLCLEQDKRAIAYKIKDINYFLDQLEKRYNIK